MELNEVTDAVTLTLIGIRVVVCYLTLIQAKEKTVLIEACNEAKVGGNVPCLRRNTIERNGRYHFLLVEVSCALLLQIL